jgi:hypothetical protein
MKPGKLMKFLLEVEREMNKKQPDIYRSVEIMLWIFWHDGKVSYDYDDGISDGEDDTPTLPPRLLLEAPYNPTPHNASTLPSKTNDIPLPDEGERNWLISRFMRTAKRLGPQSWERMRLLLLSSLSSWNEDVVVDWMLWDEDVLRREILGELYMGAPERV